MHKVARVENTLLKVLLDNLPPEKQPPIKSIVLRSGQTLFEKNARMLYVYFPSGAVVTRTYLADCGHTAEMGMVGHEGLVGTCLFLGARKTINESMVHVGGTALRMEATVALDAFQKCEPFRSSVLCHTRAWICQISQLAVCSSLHCIEKRFCRWFLMTLDRSGASQLMLSHCFIAQMLGVRRESISSTTAHLQREGVIANDHRRIRLLDRAAMEKLSCECYHVIREKYDACRQTPMSRCHVSMLEQ